MADLFDSAVSAQPENSVSALLHVENASGDWIKVTQAMLSGSGGGSGTGGDVNVTNDPLNVAVTTPVSISNFPASQVVSGPLTNTQLRSSAVDVNITNSTLTITGGLTDTQLRATALPVSLASVPTHGVTGTFWQATQPVSISTMPTTPVTGTFWQATQPVSLASVPSHAVTLASTTITGSVAVTGPLTDTQLRATAVPVSGTVAVTGAYQATQPVSIASMPTTPVTGTFWQATQPVSGTVTVSNPTAVGLTDTQLRATPVPVSGTLTVNTGLTDTQLRATPVPVSGTVAVTGAYQATQPVSIASMPSTPVTGTFWQATQPVSLTSTTITGNGFVSTNNSSAANLTASATWQGVGEDVSEYGVALIYIESSHATAANGIRIEKSTDNSTWTTTDTYQLDAAGVKELTHAPTAKFMRISVVNGLTGTTTFKAQTRYLKSAVKMSSNRPSDAGSNDFDAEVSVVYNNQWDGTSAWNRERAPLARTADPTAVSANAPVNQYMDTLGKQIVRGYATRGNTGAQFTTLSVTTATTVVAASGSGTVFRDLTNITMINTTTTASNVLLSDGTKTYRYPIPGVVGGGVQISLQVPRAATTANVVWSVTQSAAAAIDVVIDYVQTTA